MVNQKVSMGLGKLTLLYKCGVPMYGSHPYMPVGHVPSPLPGTHADVGPGGHHLHDPCQWAVID